MDLLRVLFGSTAMGLLLNALAALGAGLIPILVRESAFRAVARLFGLEKMARSESYSERMERLARQLSNASSEIDGILGEMSTGIREREANLQRLQTQVSELEAKEQEAKKRYEALKPVNLEVVNYFLEATSKSEKRAAWRDYALFAAGVVVSAVVSVVLKLAFNV